MGIQWHPLANPRRVALEVLASAMTPPPPVDLPAWAERNIEFGSESPFPGPFSLDRFPFFTRILEVLSPDHPAPFVVMRKSAQIGGTVLAQAAVAAVLDLAPCHMLYIHPNAGNAKKWMRRKFRPMVKGTPRLNAAMRPEGSRVGHSATAWERIDEAGSLQCAAAESPNDLSMASYPYQVQDDISKWPQDNGAGDPLSQADSRTSSFIKFGGKIFRTSTPLVSPGCRITDAWKEGTRETYHVACPHCDGLQPLEWENMLASTTDDANPHFTCLHCGCALEERHLPLMIDPKRGAKWVAENPAAGSYCISFDLWAAYTAIKGWRDLWKAWLRAKGDPRAEQVFFNDWLGLPFVVFGSAPEWEALRDRAEDTGLQRGIVPPRYPTLTQGVDCQEDRIEVQVTAWGPQFRRYVVDYVVIDSPITDEEGQRRLTEQLNRSYHDVWGNERTTDMMAVDANAYTNDVHAWHRKLKSGRVILVRGRGGDNVQPLERVKWERNAAGKVVKSSRRWYNVGVAGLKASLYAALRKSDPLDLGYVGFARGLGDAYFEGLTSEVRKEVRRNGMVAWQWILPAGKRNEPLDTANYCYAAAFKMGVFVRSDPAWEHQIAERDIEAPDGQADLFARPDGPAPPATPADPGRPPRARGSMSDRLA
ncbi:phage terminase large subunit family protein [Roseospira navarrensis]|uniref:Terminase n=1 Tax=Roseospira navarrensis TaxID=140058 RepID=A0A7X1ZFZ9_9PROT|nr:terminase gpA endonuclease subunit [Roseospira navarrensis]MQX37888.1 terminase [Roseospira navarrensis]